MTSKMKWAAAGAVAAALTAGLFYALLSPARPVLHFYTWADYIKPELVERFERSLDERDGTVYRLRYVSELEHHDVAARTGLSESKVKTSEKRIRLAFFSFMRGHGYFSGYEQEPKSGWLRRLWAGGG